MLPKMKIRTGTKSTISISAKRAADGLIAAISVAYSITRGSTSCHRKIESTNTVMRRDSWTCQRKMTRTPTCVYGPAAKLLPDNGTRLIRLGIQHLLTLTLSREHSGPTVRGALSEVIGGINSAIFGLHTAIWRTVAGR
jgi:hypothetical protein